MPVRGGRKEGSAREWGRNASARHGTLALFCLACLQSLSQPLATAVLGIEEDLEGRARTVQQRGGRRRLSHRKAAAAALTHVLHRQFFPNSVVVRRDGVDGDLDEVEWVVACAAL
jgi:hypothetical protein